MGNDKENKISFKSQVSSYGTKDWEKIWLRALKIGVYLILLTPLVVASFTTFPPLFPKVIYFRILVEVMFLFYLLLLIQSPKKYLPKISPLFIAILIFIEILAFSSWRGINPLRSFWGTMERMEGLILYLHLFVFFIILAGAFKKRKDWLNILRFTILVSVLVGITGIIQKLGIFHFFADPTTSRVSATLGNPVLYGSYLTLIIFLTIFLAIFEEKRKFKILFWIAFVFNFILLLFTFTRGAWIGVGLGVIFLIASWLAFFSKVMKERRKIILFGIFILLLFFLLFLLLSELNYFPETGFLIRYQSLWVELIKFENSRLMVWGLAFDAWKNSPIFGYGLESFSYIYDKYYGLELLKKVPENIFFDRVHNIIFDILIATGILGLISYLSVIATAIFVIFKNYKDKFNPFLPFVLTTLFLSHFFQNIFAFDTISSFVVFFLVLGFIDVNFRKTKDEKDSGQKEEKEKPSNKLIFPGKIILAFLTFILITISIYEVNFRLLSADIELAKANKFLASGEFQRAFDAIDKSLNESSEFARYEMYYYGVETVFFAHASPGYEGATKEFSVELQKINPFLEKYLEDKKEILQMRSYLLAARVYRGLYFMEGNDRKFLEKEEKILGTAIKFNPDFPMIYRLAGEMKFLQGRKEEGMILFAKAYELDENLAIFYDSVGRTLIETGEKEKGAGILRKGLKLGNFYKKEKFNPELLWRIADIYEETKNYKEMAAFYEEIISHCPFEKPDPQFYASLSTVYAKLGDKKKARETTLKMLELYPGLKQQAQQFLDSLLEKENK